MTIKEKLREYAEYKGFSLSKFSTIIGKSNKFLASNGSVHSDLLPIIRKNFPDLSMDWLLFDEGDMLISGEKTSISDQNSTKENSEKYQFDMIYEKLQELELFKKVVELKLEIDKEEEELKKG